jgi:hypothetical protein
MGWEMKRLRGRGTAAAFPERWTFRVHQASSCGVMSATRLLADTTSACEGEHSGSLHPHPHLTITLSAARVFLSKLERSRHSSFDSAITKR